MRNPSYYIVNGITFYRLFAAPIMVLLIISGQHHIFKWLLAFSFFTDGIDGTLARRFKVSSAFGSRLDSIADDLTITAGLIGMAVFSPGFFRQALVPFGILFILFVLQIILAYIRYGRFTSFHTYGAKIAALLQGGFLILFFFFHNPFIFCFTWLLLLRVWNY